MDFRTTKKKNKKRKKHAKEESDNDEDEDDKPIRTVKTQLKNIIRPECRQLIGDAIRDNSIKSTKICALASLLFLHNVQSAFDRGQIDFFKQDGETVIRECFFAVLDQNYCTDKMDSEFRDIVNSLDRQHRIDWPTNEHFGNAINDLIKTYTTNVRTNLKYLRNAK